MSMSRCLKPSHMSRCLTPYMTSTKRTQFLGCGFAEGTIIRPSAESSSIHVQMDNMPPHANAATEQRKKDVAYSFLNVVPGGACDEANAISWLR